MTDPIENLLDDLHRYPELVPSAQRDLLAKAHVVATASTAELRSLLASLQQLADRSDNESLVELATALLTASATRPSRDPDSFPREPFDPTMIRLIRQLYAHPALATCQGHLLRLLSSDAGPASLETFADLLAEQPPTAQSAIDQAFVPLFQHPPTHASHLFPRLLDALAHPELASAVLDTANFITRQNLAPAHPARDQVERLARLLSELTNYLQSISEQPPTVDDVSALQQRLATTTALFISLCDALSLIGEPSIRHRLYPALELPHRRLQTEAAAALARLGDERGFEVLERLAAEPVVRNRVLAYLVELQADERMPAEFRTEAAREGQLASWLAAPFPIWAAAHRLELVDSRRLYWPGYEQPVTCYLFSFTYEFPARSWGGVGLVGPVTHAVAADLEHLTPLDIYATYAGWHAEHPDITELSLAQPPDEGLAERLRQAGFDHAEPVLIGRFFDQRLLVYTAGRTGQPGTVIVDQSNLVWYPAANPRQPVTPTDAYNQHKGRKLLQQFNPDLEICSRTGGI